MTQKAGVRYRNPPLIEALCEFSFQETGIPSNIVLGELYEQIEEDFPTVETHRGIDVQAEEDTPAPSVAMKERTRFVSKDRTRLIQVGPGLLVANQLKPYRDYQSFRQFIRATMDIYCEVAKPSGLGRIGLRYINRIGMMPGQCLEEVFHIGFRIPALFQTFPDPYLLRTEFTYCGERDRLVVIFATAPPQEDSPNAVMLDFEYILFKPEEISDELLGWMDEAHERIEDAFHACLTESAIETFEPEEL